MSISSLLCDQSTSTSVDPGDHPLSSLDPGDDRVAQSEQSMTADQAWKTLKVRCCASFHFGSSH